MTGGKFKLPKGYREVIEAAREEAGPLGLNVSYTITGRHPKLHISDGVNELTVPFSCTPRVNMQAEMGRRKIRNAARRLAAQAISARQGQDRNGLGAKPASAVAESDAPNLPPNPSPEAP